MKNSGFEEEIKLLLKNWLKNGKCLILCDGLDEVRQNKESIISSLKNLTSGGYGNCHILVTTRIVGYSNELSGWKHYEVMPLAKEHIEQYAKNYLKAQSLAFLSGLKDTPQMEPFSKNPLLLQLLCFVFVRHRLVLPAGRVELYDKAVNEMLERKNPEIPLSVKKKVLQEIASLFLEQGKEVFEEGELRELIKNSLTTEKEDYRPDDVLKEIVEKSGLLCRLGDERYIFLHLTFEEYFCACYIVGQASCLSFLEPVLFNPRFREVVKLVAGRLPKDKVWGFIEFIRNQKPLCSDVLHQPLLLAGFCMADIPNAQANPALEKEILNKLLRLWKETEFRPLREEIDRVFSAMAGTRNWEKIANFLLMALKEKDREVHGGAASTLGRLSKTDDKVISALLGVLKGEYSGVRYNAASALGRLGKTDDRVISALLGALKDKVEYVRDGAYSALQKLAERQAREKSVKFHFPSSQASVDTFFQEKGNTIKEL